jgi:hypothetical protein
MFNTFAQIAGRYRLAGGTPANPGVRFAGTPGSPALAKYLERQR